MIVLLSPAKTLDFETEPVTTSASQPVFQEETQYLVQKLRKLSSKQIGKLMSVNPEIADTNYQRYQQFEDKFHGGNSKQAMLAFTGEVYRGLNATVFSEPEFEFAQQHIRILSGLYGVLKPLDLIQPYRLEMGTRLKVTAKKTNLYHYWGDTLRETLDEEANGAPILNLASNEYFKAAKEKELKSPVYHCQFQDFKNGEYKTLMTYAKNARGAMARYIIKNSITDINDIKSFDLNGYKYNDRLSEGNTFYFTRD
ncbi:MAG: peroxide stress protein YaaA [Flavobacteriales bacterium]|nr:peroxide stress protein YaaA [Flavobacteriales bacterium]